MSSTSTSVIAATYIMPILLTDAVQIDEIASYLGSLGAAQIIVVDGSPSSLFVALDAALSTNVLHVRPDAKIAGLNGKVRGVLTGLRLACHHKIVVADDDVRYSSSSLEEIVRLLESADVVRPQNYFSPTPWHAVLDTSRSLINRALDGDWPGTLAFRKAALPRGYCPDVLFENLELVRTITSSGGLERVARDLFVMRLPPRVQHFWRQRIRQAYDEFARPVRLCAALAIVPVVAVACLKRNWTVPVAMALTVQATAAVGWARDGGPKYFSLSSVAAAPLWALERGICAWFAVYSRLRFGGARYGTGLIRKAILTTKERAQWAL